MAFPPNSEDRPDPLENMPAVRARIPEHVARGEISTGVIVVTGGTEYVLDFVRNLPRPSCVVARVVLPHLVMPQFIDALSTNIELFRQRYGELPGMPAPTATLSAPQVPASETNPASGAVANSGIDPSASNPATLPEESQQTASESKPFVNENLSGGGGAPAQPLESNSIDVHAGSVPPSSPPPNPNAPKRQNPQDVYDELKLRDEILSGSYANAVMIGHGPFEFSFDFITNFYPQSAVSCRVYMAAGHIARLLESLKASWEQLRPRYGYPPKN